MQNLSSMREHMEGIGADGLRLGMVDRIEGGGIKLAKEGWGRGPHVGHHHFIPGELAAGRRGRPVRLSANSDVATLLEEESDGQTRL